MANNLPPGPNLNDTELTETSKDVVVVVTHGVKGVNGAATTIIKWGVVLIKFKPLPSSIGGSDTNLNTLPEAPLLEEHVKKTSDHGIHDSLNSTNPR